VKSVRRLLGIVALSTLALGGCEGRKHSSSSSEHKKTGPAIAVIDLSNGVPEIEPSGFFGPMGPKKSFDELLRVVDDVADDKNALGVLVRFGGARIGAARSQEIGTLLAKLREKKKVWCHADALSNATMMAAARGCTSLWVSPAGEVETIGIAAQILYMRRLLADELHFSIDFLQIGKFKGAEEPITRDGPSPEARQSLTDVLVDMRASWLETLAQGRPKPGIAALAEDGPYSATRAKELGLVDQVGYADEVFTEAKKETGAVRDQIVFGSGAEDPGDDLEDIVRLLAGESAATGPVALVRATGSIAMTAGGNGIFGGRGGILEKEFDRTIRSLEKDDDVKAVVVRIDSPGGSALASDLMWHHLMKLRKKKPLVFSVGDMAASGGYYLASSGDYIFAEPMSIVGSIGVVGGKIGIGDALEKVGVHAETFPANLQSPGAAARASYESLFTKWDDPTRERVRASMTSIYDLFLSRVSEGRSTRGRTISREKIAESAEGRIFSGRIGKDRGLVDEIGGLAAALAKAKELAGLPPTAHVAAVAPKPTFLDALEPPASPAEEKLRAATSPMAILDRVAPELVPFVGSVAPLAEGEHAVVAMPFALTVK
jgi:protease-4